MTTYINEEEAAEFQRQCSTFYHSNQFRLVDKPAPSDNRECTDTCCLVTFISILLAFLIYSAISIEKLFGSDQFNNLNPSDTETFLAGFKQKQFQTFGAVLGVSVVGSLGIALIVGILLKCMPENMVIGMSFMGVVALVATGIVEIVMVSSGFGAYFFGIAFIYGAFVCYYWDDLIKAAILMKTVGAFILETKKILLIVVLSLFYCLVILALWIITLYSFCTQYSHGQLSSDGFGISLAFWLFVLFFFNFYFYYTSVFITAQGIAIWFYDLQQQYDLIVQPFKHMTRYHLGTVTFASMTITLSKLLKFLLLLAHLKDSDGAFALIGMFMACIIHFCLGALQAIIQVINNYSIILCSLTGFNMMDSARLSGEMIFNDPNDIFKQFTMAMYFIRSGGVIMVSIVPTLVSGIYLNGLQTLPSDMWILGVVIVMFTSSMIGLLMIQIWTQATSALFIIYTLDGKLSSEGLDVVWVESFAQELEKGFDQAFVGRIQKKNVKTKKRTTYVIQPDGTKQVYKGTIVVPNETTDQITQEQMV